MIDHRPFASLGRARHGWLDARHHFSFADYHDPERMGWGALRVLNDDEIAPHRGFPMHPHRDMEIVTYVRQGAISHEDSLGHRGRTAAGAVQVMSAGSGLRHSETNREDETTALFQLWIRPREDGGAPCWATAQIVPGDGSGPVRVVASGFPGDGAALSLRADARVLHVALRAGGRLTHPLEPNGHAYAVVARGSLRLKDLTLGERDGAAISGERDLDIEAIEDCDLLVIETL